MDCTAAAVRVVGSVILLSTQGISTPCLGVIFYLFTKNVSISAACYLKHRHEITFLRNRGLFMYVKTYFSTIHYYRYILP